MVIGNLGCVTHGATMVLPHRISVRCKPSKRLAGTLHDALWSAQTMFIAELGHPPFREFDSLDTTDRYHGGSALPGGGNERVISEMHCRELPSRAV